MRPDSPQGYRLRPYACFSTCLQLFVIGEGIDNLMVIYFPEITLIEKFPEDNARQGFFEREEFERVVSFRPEDLQDFARFAYHAGWRRNEIASLTWHDVREGTIRLRPEFSKTKDGRVLVLVGELACGSSGRGFKSRRSPSYSK